MMAIECNIEARGKFLRLVLGSLSIIGSIPLVLLTVVYGVLDPMVGWALIGMSWAGGALGIFEGWSGFCVARGLGFRTPI